MAMSMDSVERIPFPQVPQVHPAQGDIMGMVRDFLFTQANQEYQQRQQLALEGSKQAINERMGTYGQDPTYNQVYQTGELGNQKTQQEMQFAKQNNDNVNQFYGGIDRGAVSGNLESDNPAIQAMIRMGVLGSGNPLAGKAVMDQLAPMGAQGSQFAHESQLAQMRSQEAAKSARELAGIQNQGEIDKLNQLNVLKQANFKENQTRWENSDGSIKNYIANGGDPQLWPYFAEERNQSNAAKVKADEDAKLLILEEQRKARGGKSEEQFKKDDEYNQRHGLYQYATPQDQEKQKAQAEEIAQRKRAFDEYWNKAFGLYGNKKIDPNQGSWSPANH